MQLQTSDDFVPLVAQLGGLDENRTYRVSVVEELSSHEFLQKQAPGWWPAIEASGSILAKIGVEIPVLRPEQGVLLKVQAL
jgi:alpha-galactosidase